MEKKTFNHILLEYNQKQECFHDNPIFGTTPNHTPDTNGWVTIANTFDSKSYPFCLMVDLENIRRKEMGKKAMSAAEVKIKWREYSYIYNHILTFSVEENYLKCVKSEFDSPKALARLGHPSFMKETDEGYTDYDPLSFIDSNF